MELRERTRLYITAFLTFVIVMTTIGGAVWAAGDADEELIRARAVSHNENDEGFADPDNSISGNEDGSYISESEEAVMEEAGSEEAGLAGEGEAAAEEGSGDASVEMVSQNTADGGYIEFRILDGNNDVSGGDKELVSGDAVKLSANAVSKNSAGQFIKDVTSDYTFSWASGTLTKASVSGNNNDKEVWIEAKEEGTTALTVTITGGILTQPLPLSTNIIVKPKSTPTPAEKGKMYVSVNSVSKNNIDSIAIDIAKNETLTAYVVSANAATGVIENLPAGLTPAYTWKIKAGGDCVDISSATGESINVTAKKVGTATLTASANVAGTDAVPKDITITVNPAKDKYVKITPSGNYVSGSEALIIYQYAFQFTGEVMNPDGTKAADQTISWNSSNKSVATVSDNGVVTMVGMSENPVTITATPKTGGESRSVTVYPGYAYFNPTSYTVEVGSSQTITPVFVPSKYASHMSFNYSRDKTTYATVTSSGRSYIIKGTLAGTFKFSLLSKAYTKEAGGSGTATTKYIVSSCNITVKNGSTSPTSSSDYPWPGKYYDFGYWEDRPTNSSSAYHASVDNFDSFVLVFEDADTSTPEHDKISSLMSSSSSSKIKEPFYVDISLYELDSDGTMNGPLTEKSEFGSCTITLPTPFSSTTNRAPVVYTTTEDDKGNIKVESKKPSWTSRGGKICVKFTTDHFTEFGVGYSSSSSDSDAKTTNATSSSSTKKSSSSATGAGGSGSSTRSLDGVPKTYDDLVDERPFWKIFFHIK